MNLKIEKNKFNRPSKGPVHLYLQHHIYHLFEKEGSQIEKAFPEIGRIADVFIEMRRLIFEIQCSLIPYLEVERREEDYGKLGYQVVWILHDSCFNQRQMSPSERRIRSKTSYYANHRPDGSGYIYDESQSNHKGSPTGRRLRFNVDLTESRSLSAVSPHLLNNFPREKRSWQFYHKGDLIDQILNQGVAEASLKPSFRRRCAKIYRNFLIRSIYALDR